MYTVVLVAGKTFQVPDCRTTTQRRDDFQDVQDGVPYFEQSPPRVTSSFFKNTRTPLVFYFSSRPHGTVCPPQSVSSYDSSFKLMMPARQTRHDRTNCAGTQSTTHAVRISNCYRAPSDSFAHYCHPTGHHQILPLRRATLRCFRRRHVDEREIKDSTPPYVCAAAPIVLYVTSRISTTLRKLFDFVTFHVFKDAHDVASTPPHSNRLSGVQS